MKIASIQMVSTQDVDENLKRAQELIQHCAQLGAECVVLPEYFCLMGLNDEEKLVIAENTGQGKLQDFLATQAKKYQVYLVGGTIPLSRSSGSNTNTDALLDQNINNDNEASLRVFNACLVFNPQGVRIARYDKIHLFSFKTEQEYYDEARVLKAGSNTSTFNLKSADGKTWKIGLSICYDLRFPELYRVMQPDIILVPSAFTYTTGQAHWEVLLRARAIENLAFVVSCAQGGVHTNGRHTWGHSMIINPWGKVLECLEQGEGVVIADLDYQQMQTYRQQLPALKHRKL